MDPSWLMAMRKLKASDLPAPGLGRAAGADTCDSQKRRCASYTISEDHTDEHKAKRQKLLCLTGKSRTLNLSADVSSAARDTFAGPALSRGPGDQGKLTEYSTTAEGLIKSLEHITKLDPWIPTGWKYTDEHNRVPLPLRRVSIAHTGSDNVKFATQVLDRVIKRNSSMLRDPESVVSKPHLGRAKVKLVLRALETAAKGLQRVHVWTLDEVHPEDQTALPAPVIASRLLIDFREVFRLLGYAIRDSSETLGGVSLDMSLLAGVNDRAKTAISVLARVSTILLATRNEDSPSRLAPRYALDRARQINDLIEEAPESQDPKRVSDDDTSTTEGRKGEPTSSGK